MTIQEALQVFESIAEGRHPSTGEQLEDSSPLASGKLYRASVAALEALREKAERDERQKELAAKTPNSGKPWTDEQSARLAESFERNAASGLSLSKNLGALAGEHGRTANAVRSQLERLGKLDSRVAAR